ncbi:ABC transporter ATP-binding protein/permease [Catenovulum sp. 2E275]|uniref:ABC transporter ATP-binding protein n=1 Tax=Catenovulum sp. 2E275 TaxID=2980497 RepID=UPI0021CF1E2A|nr:ABC transporter ATP-binding protein [Catenovulum sp. 2E275]MCU4674865.1 ABC transporter ATP-binding protein/permease [Catenovulum sp. 2E275]
MYGFFERLVKPFPPEQPEQPPATLFAFCRHYTKGIEVHLILMAVLTAGLAIIEASLMGFLGQLVDLLAKSTPDAFFAEQSTRLIAMTVLVLVIAPLCIWLHTVIVHQTLLGNYPMIIRWQAHRYLLGQSISFFQNDFAGRVATKVMQTALAVRESVMKLLDVFMYVIVYFISMLVLIAQADPRLLLPILLWMAAYIGLQIYYVPKLKQASMEQADARSVMSGRIVDSYTNINTVKLFAHTEQEATYAKDGMNDFLKTVYKQMRIATGMISLVQITNYVLAFVVCAVSIWLWKDNLITVGAIAVAVSLALRLNGMSQWIMWEISGLFENIGTVADGMTTLAKPRDVQDKAQAEPLTVAQGKIEFKQVKFNYGDEHSVFNNLNLTIKPGEKVGIVGRSGAGKSSLVNLLMRFYDINSGQILIDGQDISAVLQESLRAQIGMVTQDTSLLHRSVRENILYGKKDATEAELLSAAKQAEADGFIQDLTDFEGRRGYDAQVGERGVKLSGGQRQRIAIARVLLKDAPILILDEATSALDSEVEAAIQQSLYQLMEGKTVIAIAHRLSTIAAMDRLIVLDKGEIVEQGSHQQLIEQGGIYAQLWAHQTGGFIGVDTDD